MTPRKKDIRDIRDLGMRLLAFANEKELNKQQLGAAKASYTKLVKLAAKVSNCELNDHYKKELNFALDMICDPKIKKICVEKEPQRRVELIYTPFESSRKKH